MYDDKYVNSIKHKLYIIANKTWFDYYKFISAGTSIKETNLFRQPSHNGENYYYYYYYYYLWVFHCSIWSLRDIKSP